MCKGWTALETPNGWFQMIRGPRPPSVREKAPQQETWGLVETTQSSGSPAVSTEDSHHKGGTASTGMHFRQPRTKVEDIGVETFPRSRFQSRHQRQEFRDWVRSRMESSSERKVIWWSLRAEHCRGSIADAERRLEKLRAQADLCANRWPSWRGPA